MRVAAVVVLVLACIPALVVLLRPSVDIKPPTQELNQPKLEALEGKMLTSEGRLAFTGYSPFPRYEWNPPEWSTRVKGWDYYSVSTDLFLLSVAVVDLKYAGNVFITYYPKSQSATTEELVLLGPWHGVSLSAGSEHGTSSYNDGSWSVSINSDNSGKNLEITAPVFKGTDSQGVNISLRFEKPKETEGLFVMVPLNDDKSQYFISHKQYDYEVSGQFTANGTVLILERERGMMDWVRSNWPYAGGWVWASASTSKSSELRASINLCTHSVTAGGPSEDAVFINGKLLKTGVTVFSYDPADLTSDFTFKSLSQQPTDSQATIEATFHPALHYNKHQDFLIVSSELLQLFGTYSVTVHTPTSTYIFEAQGLVEVHKSRW